MKRLLSIGLLTGFTLALAQTPPPAGARDLYFGGFENPPAKKTAVTAAPPTQRKPTAPAAPAPVSPPSAAKNITVSTSDRPLGLRYSILKVDGANKQEVPASARFQAGDRIQIKIQSNSDGYLYIVNQGTSGNWQVLFPSKSHTSNRVKAGEDYTLPNNSSMRFAGQPGVEKLFVVLSRTPETDLDAVIYNLKTTPRQAGSEEPLQIASATVGDPLVSRLRSSSTRDLVLEESSGAAPAAEESKTGANQEKATYVVSRSHALDARVVADIRLTHE